MLQKFENHINTKFPFLKNKKVLIAISGGIDSVVLTHLLHQLNYQISLAHCNFQLRGDASDLDQEFIIKLGKKLTLNTYTTQFETVAYAQKQKLSTQLTARTLRYNWFHKLIAQHAFDYVLTAHHADDNLETFLINLTRGTGLEGLTGIPETNGVILRPLLPFSREDIITYAKKHDINWREDQSNSSTKYIRNKIRHQVIPVLKEINPSLLSSFSKTSNYLQESQDIIDDNLDAIAKKVSKKEISDTGETTTFNIEEINQLSNPKAYLYQFLKAYHFTEWNDVYQLLSAQSGKHVFSKTHVLLKNRDVLILSRKSANTFNETFEIAQHQTEIKHPVVLRFEDATHQSTKNKNTIFLDKEKLEFPLRIRKWKNGDVFYPFGMQGKKKVSKYFKDEKFSLFQKQRTWLLCDNSNTIIWIIGYRADSRCIASKHSKTVLKVSF